MYVHQVQKRVRYAETDKMGYLYYGNYALYYEIGRVEALRELGMTYQQMEDEQKVMMPVMSFYSKYIRPAYYDNLLTIKTIVDEMPRRDILFKGEIYNQQDQLINTAEVKLAFVSIKDYKRMHAPSFFLDLIKPYFNG